MSDLVSRIDAYVGDLRSAGVSPHTVRAYAADLAQFLEFLAPAGAEPPCHLRGTRKPTSTRVTEE